MSIDSNEIKINKETIDRKYIEQICNLIKMDKQGNKKYYNKNTLKSTLEIVHNIVQPVLKNNIYDKLLLIKDSDQNFQTKINVNEYLTLEEHILFNWIQMNEYQNYFYTLVQTELNEKEWERIF